MSFFANKKNSIILIIFSIISVFFIYTVFSNTKLKKINKNLSFEMILKAEELDQLLKEKTELKSKLEELNIENINEKSSITLPKNGSYSFREYYQDLNVYSNYSPYLEYYMLNNLYKDVLSYESFTDEENNVGAFMIKAENGKEVKVVDNNDDSYAAIFHRLIGYFSDINSFVFEYYGWEKGGILIVNLETGKNTYLDFMPSYFSSDSKYFAVVVSQVDAYMTNGVKIYKIEDNGEINKLANPFYENSCYPGCDIASWSNDRIVVNFTHFSDEDFEEYSKVIELKDDMFNAGDKKFPFVTKSTNFCKTKVLKNNDLLILDAKKIDEMRKNREIILELIPRYPEIYKNLSMEFKKDEEIVEAGLSIRPYDFPRESVPEGVKRYYD